MVSTHEILTVTDGSTEEKAIVTKVETYRDVELAYIEGETLSGWVER